MPVPRLIAAGTIVNAPYIIMSEVGGKTLQHSWADLSSVELRTIAGEIGSITAQLHGQPQDKLAAVEAKFGGRVEICREMEANRSAEIEANANFSTRHKDELLEFLHGEARDFLDTPPVLTHSDLSHAHIYIARTNHHPAVSGVIDWAEAMLGPAEWDTSFHWFWTFSQDKPTMQACLNSYYRDGSRPDQLARRCFATHLYTYSMQEVWDYFTKTVSDSEAIVRAMISTLFPPDVFGAPD
jgi:hygromycin-B 7''-O-kinase